MESKAYWETNNYPSDAILNKLLIRVGLQVIMPVQHFKWCSNVLGRGGDDNEVRNINNVLLPRCEPVIIRLRISM